MREIGLYVHIPFCKQKCYYCDFCSYANKLELQEKYIEAVIQEINNIKNPDEYKINTIYIGGGTPSIINPELIKNLLGSIKNKFLISEIAEITIEVNPGTVDREKFKMYKESGINRVSIGLQSSNDFLLKEIGRIHNYKDFEDAYNMAVEVGFSNINVDLMIGLPNQIVDDVEQTLISVIKKNPKHVSVYSLIVEPGTVMEKLINEGKLQLPSEENERNMYWRVKNLLEQNGYMQYEISNFSKEGYESKHNMNCWNQSEYMGLGAAAHSYLNATRYSNIEKIEDYIHNAYQGEFEKNIIIHEKQTISDMMKEYMIIGLRKLSRREYRKIYRKI